MLIPPKQMLSQKGGGKPELRKSSRGLYDFNQSRIRISQSVQQSATEKKEEEKTKREEVDERKRNLNGQI